eukprot:1351319-Amorphochlora_amoeboformis.AAC.1
MPHPEQARKSQDIESPAWGLFFLWLLLGLSFSFALLLGFTLWRGFFRLSSRFGSLGGIFLALDAVVRQSILHSCVLRLSQPDSPRNPEPDPRIVPRSSRQLCPRRQASLYIFSVAPATHSARTRQAVMSSTGEDTGGADGMDKAEDNVGISVSALGGVEKEDPVEVKTERLEAKKAYVDRFYHAPKPTDTDTQPNDEQKEESGQQQQRPQPTGLDQELSVPRQGIALRKSDPAFILGFDIFSEEEIQKRKARAEKFGTTV